MIQLSMVVVVFNMRRELPRTLRSLSAAMQRGLLRSEYEIIVVDNGSTEPFDEDLCLGWDADVVFHHMKAPSASPAAAVNAGLALCRADLIGVMIDGARLASPGLLHGATRAAKLHARPVISSHGFHLGPAPQSHALKTGYGRAVEDRLLEYSGWTEDGYALFDISVFAESSAGGWFRPIAESNALFLTREMWTELGGYDERFVSPGGGLVNLDTYARACGLPDAQLITLLGEGTFHQIHGGVSANAPSSRWDEYHAEFVRIRRREYRAPQLTPWFFGAVHPCVLTSMRHSVETARAGVVPMRLQRASH